MSDIENKFKLPSRFTKSKSVWLEYENLALLYKPINLGIGFPDCPPPQHLTETLAEVARSDNCLLHQYTRDYGHPRLVQVLGKLYSNLLDRQLDPQNEILITVGASEALFSSILSHVDVGDEVIIIEPFFDSYVPLVKIAGGVPRFASLTSPEWTFDREKFESLFNARTKMIILNNPHNSFGKVYKREELEFVARLCVKWNVLCISDEVYEWTVFKPCTHVRIATLPGMWERTITIGSAGKTFNVTGWKVGWAYGPSKLLNNLMMVHQNSVYTGITPIQETVAIGLEKELSRFDQEDCYFKVLSEELKSKRDFMINIFNEIGMKPILSEGGYFMTVDWSPLESHVDLSSENDKTRDYQFTKWLIKNVGVQGIPLTAFYSDEHRSCGENFVRFCFFKKSDTLQEAANRLKKWKNSNVAQNRCN